MFTLRQYLLSLSESRGLTRTLGEVELYRDELGRPCYSAGNSAVVFRIRRNGRIQSLRCYLRTMRHLREIYGDKLLEKELYIYTSSETGVWVDVVLGDWIEGMTLHETAAEAVRTRDTERLRSLAEAFDALAAGMVADDCAHGDLKPENIIVDPAGKLHPIDFDAAYLPAFAGETSPELGTAAYQHPARTAGDFNERLDDYPAALISTALHALAADPAFWERHGNADGALFPPRDIPNAPAYREALALFERRGMALQYRIAQLLRSPSLQLFGLPELLAETVRQAAAGDSADSAIFPELFVENGRWGYRTPTRVVVPTLYDSGFDFTEGLAAVLLGRTWHYIDTAGRTQLSCPGCEAVKPFRAGRAQVVRNGRRIEIDRAGNERVVAENEFAI